MNTGKYVFAQITSFLPQRQFDRIISKHSGNYKTRHFTCWNQMLCMMFGQLSSRESLRDLVITLMPIPANCTTLVLAKVFLKQTLQKQMNCGAI